MNERLLKLCLLGILTFCLLTMNTPAISGDEAVYTMILDEWQRLLTGGGFLLNQLMGYTGPFDFWLMGSLYGMLSGVLDAQPWMVRVVPFTVLWIGAFVLARELRDGASRLHLTVTAGENEQESPAATNNFVLWYLLLLASCPLVLIWAHVGFPHALLIGVFAILVSEVFRVARTGEVRWLRIALIAGFSTECHTTAFLGHLIVFLPVLPALARATRRSPGKALLALVIYCLLAYPVVKNFPPPAAVDAEKGRSIGDELIAVLSIVAGHQPFRFLLHLEPVPRWTVLGFLFFLGAVFTREVRRLIRTGFSGIWPRVWLTHLIGTFFLLVMAYRGKSFTFIGHERYFLPLVPGWTLFWAQALWNFLPARRPWVCTGVVAYFFLQFAIPIMRYAPQTDPAWTAARWLEKNCPRSTCVASTLDFWSYWPIRYYLRGPKGLVDLNIETKTWKVVEIYSPEGRVRAGCWPVRNEAEFQELRQSRGSAMRPAAGSSALAPPWLYIPLEDAASAGFGCGFTSEASS